MIDLIIILAFVAYSITAGFRAKSKASKNLEEYFLAGKTLTGWKAGLSMAATQFAADTPLLVTGLIATGGIFLLWRLWIYGIAFLMMGFIFGASWRRAGVLTDAELTEIRYSGKGVLLLRVLKAVYYGTVINCIVLAMVLVAAVRISEVFLPWNEWLPPGLYDLLLTITRSLGLYIGTISTAVDPAIATTNNLISILLILGFTALYSTTGGLRSVVVTDLMQFVLAMIGTLIYAFIIVDHVGGLAAMVEKMSAIYGSETTGKLLSFGPPGGEMLMPFLIIISIQWFFQMNSDGTGYLAQRTMACATDKDARIAAMVFTWMQVLVRSLIWLVIGVGLLVIYPFTPETASGDHFVAARELLFVTGIDDLLPIGIRGLMLTGLLAALASTIDTHLNWGASYWSNDVYNRLICNHWLKREPKNRELVLVARLSSVIILIIAIIIMANLGSIQTTWFISLLFGAGMGSVLVMRWLWERINLHSELAAMAISLVLAPILLFATNVGWIRDEEWIRLSLMALFSTVAAVTVTYFTPRTDEKVLKAFYKRVNPVGFWRNTATLVDGDPRKPLNDFIKETRTTILTALSLFLMLIGTGKLLVRPPTESSFFPWLCIALALVLIRFWWKNAIGGHRVTSFVKEKDS